MVEVTDADREQAIEYQADQLRPFNKRIPLAERFAAHAADTRAKMIEECARAVQGTNADLCRDAGLAYRACYNAVLKLGEQP